LDKEPKNYDLDYSRQLRTGIDEIIYAESKPIETLKQIIQEKIKSNNKAFVSRITSDQVHMIEDSFPILLSDSKKRNMILSTNKLDLDKSKKIAIVTGGSSDLYIAEEANLLLNYHGYQSQFFLDKGVAMTSRALKCAEEIERDSTIFGVIAIAGFEGALFSVLSANLSKPLIAIPVPIGYGVNQNGMNALNSALGTCSTGVAVVNIENGIGAASFFIKMLNQI
jgi:pyridinium-3,5-biscarboxylic acid mononucleotide synthase